MGIALPILRFSGIAFFTGAPQSQARSLGRNTGMQHL